LSHCSASVISPRHKPPARGRTKTLQQESRSLGITSENHIPSAGITLETLKSFPFPYNHYSNNAPTYQTWTYYQPMMYGGYRSFGYPYYSYGFRPYGMGGYYPPGAGGRYRANIGFLLPLW
jgi:hypothetical protein